VPRIAPVPDADLHGPPTVAELLEAVREFLAGDVMAATEGQVRFHARVAANVVAMVERELQLAAGQTAVHRAALEALGVGSEDELARAIRAGDLDDRIDEVVAAVRETARARLAVANPGYAGGHSSSGGSTLC
jgi:AcrR family transcriptional regulator